MHPSFSLSCWASKFEAKTFKGIGPNLLLLPSKYGFGLHHAISLLRYRKNYSIKRNNSRQIFVLYLILKVEYQGTETEQFSKRRRDDIGRDEKHEQTDIDVR